MHENNIASRVNLARVKILRGGSFLHESKNKTEKSIHIKNKQKNKKRQTNIKTKRNKKLMTEGKG